MNCSKATEFHRKSGQGLGYPEDDPERRRRGTIRRYPPRTLTPQQQYPRDLQHV